MKISQLITLLQAVQADRGDLDVLMQDEYGIPFSVQTVTAKIVHDEVEYVDVRLPAGSEFVILD